MHTGAARIVCPVNISLLFNKMHFLIYLIFFPPSLIVLDSFNFNISQFFCMSQDFICESLIRLELEGIQYFCETLCEFVARDHSIPTLNFVGRGIILSVIFGIFPKCSTLNFFLNQMLSGFFDNMLFFERHRRRRRCRCLVLIIINEKLVRFSVMSPLLLHLYARLPLWILLEATLIRPPFLRFRLIVEFRLVSIYPLKLFSILLCQTLKHILLSFVNNFSNSLSRTLVSSVAQSCIFSLFQAIGPFLVNSDESLEVKSSCMAFVESVLLQNCVRGNRWVPYKLQARILC